MLQRCFVWNQWCWTGLCCLRLTVLSLSRCSLCWSFRTCILVILTHVKLHCRYPGQKKKPNFSKRNISTRLLGILSSSDLALSDTKKKHQTPTQKPTHQNPEQGVDMFIFVPWFPSLKRMCLSSAGVTDADTNCNFYVSDVCSYKYCFSKLQPIGSKCSEPKWMWLVKHHWVPNMGRQQPVACLQKPGDLCMVFFTRCRRLGCRCTFGTCRSAVQDVAAPAGGSRSISTRWPLLTTFCLLVVGL